jgi:hypothetical protein
VAEKDTGVGRRRNRFYAVRWPLWSLSLIIVTGSGWSVPSPNMQILTLVMLHTAFANLQLGHSFVTMPLLARSIPFRYAECFSIYWWEPERRYSSSLKCLSVFERIKLSFELFVSHHMLWLIRKIVTNWASDLESLCGVPTTCMHF